MQPEGNAIVYCEGAYNTPNGKTAHGLVRFTRRYRVLSVIDSRYEGQDAGMILDGKKNGVPVVGSMKSAVDAARRGQLKATHLVVGLAPDGGRLSDTVRKDIATALEMGLNVDSGLHDFLSEDLDLMKIVSLNGVKIRDIRRSPDVKNLHFFSGQIEQVKALKIALLGTDSAVGKRTTAWKLVQGLENKGLKAEMIGTGQTSWLQGVHYGIIMDALVNDFVSGELEHAIMNAWQERQPDVIVIEGQGSLMNPAYPGGFEILAAGRPDVIILQHAPNRRDYDGFPGYPIHSLKKQILVIELLSDKPVVAITINHEGFTSEAALDCCRDIGKRTGLPAYDVLLEGTAGLVSIVKGLLSC
jgi:uncharacterized NAD-dependent epimerase/dehydratase family protein